MGGQEHEVERPIIGNQNLGMTMQNFKTQKDDLLQAYEAVAASNEDPIEAFDSTSKPTKAKPFVTNAQTTPA